ncbi:MAG: flagellar biosynthetic protein FliO [Myxococcales bacterium]|jgi:hypothetical protein
MGFAECLRSAAQAPPASKLRRPIIQAAVGLAGLVALPFLSGAVSFAGQSARVLAALAGATFLAFFALRLLAARQRRIADATPLRVVARTSLSPRTGIALVDVEGQRLVLAYGDGFASLLTSKPLPLTGDKPLEGDAR